MTENSFFIAICDFFSAVIIINLDFTGLYKSVIKIKLFTRLYKEFIIAYTLKKLNPNSYLHVLNTV
jgi:hypothetical protein